jgi:thiol-disulfide isomerase/thioredoxin
MMKNLIATCAMIAAALCQVVSAQELTLGSKAPKLELKKFIKGESVKGFEKGKIYVVELWATWCGPCRTTIPHLTELQKKYKDVTIIDAFEAVGACSRGLMSREDVDTIERAICPGEGACGGMYTANTMASAAEAMGMSIPGSAAPPAVDRRRDGFARRSGRIYWLHSSQFVGL